MACLAIRPIEIGHINLDIHTMLFSGLFMIVGSQTICFAVFAKYIAGYQLKIHYANEYFLQTLKHFTLERGLIIGLALVLSGLLGAVCTFWYWLYHSFGPLAPTQIMRILIPSTTFLILGIQFIFASFFMSVLEMHYRR
jgi:hypothetical protein